MTISVKVVRIFFAISLVAWGIQHFILGDFIAGRPPAWPEILPGKIAFAYVSGLILVIAGISIIANYKAMLATFSAGIMILLWAGLRNIYALISTLDYGFILTSTGKALTIGFGAMLVSSTFTSNTESSNALKNNVEKLAPLAKYFTGLFLLASGIQHFLFAEFVKYLMPTWIPGATFWTYFAGVALAAGGLGILTGIQRKLAATLSGSMIFVWIFVLHLPRALGKDGNANEWTAVFEALAVSGLLFIIAATNKKTQL